MELICNCCKEIFDILDREYKRQIKKGRIVTEFYCSRSCSSKGNSIKRFGEIVIEIEEVKCNKCGNNFEIKYREGKKKDKYFCSRSCANSRNWSEEDKLKKSLSLKGRKSKYDAWNKGRILKPKRYKICKNCGNLHRNKVFCSKKCLSEFALKDKTDLEIYRKKCRFNFSLNEYPNEFDFSLIEKYGWYRAKNKGDNLNGVSRDHMYSIYDGFHNRIDSEIIKHPTNCQLLANGKNSSKWKKSSITIEELKQRIKEWNIKYKE